MNCSPSTNVTRREVLKSTLGSIVAWRARSIPGLTSLQTSRPVPTPSQLAWQRDELALFIHFGVNTFSNREWGDGTEDPRSFNPIQFDAGQWGRTAREAGFRTMVLTAKHHDGFCLWPSQWTEHSVKSSPWPTTPRGKAARPIVAWW